MKLYTAIRKHDKETAETVRALEKAIKQAEKLVSLTSQAENLAEDLDYTICREIAKPARLARQAAESKLRESQSLLRQYVLARAALLKDLINKV